ncbi:MAG: helix-turn-helix transcriptional regulator [Thermoanaerobacteraceae bacterium]|nr:helix-turn-helix transcriptional regulator [Thermoanaerobacteraceae bacterium]
MDYRELLAEELRDPQFKKAWDELELEYRISGLLIKLRNEAGLTQAELAEKIGTTQSAIARMESGKVIPKLDSLARIAMACGKRLEISVK